MTKIKETRDYDGTLEAGVYKELDGSYSWVTYTKSGNCKKLATAMRKAGL